MTQRRKLLLADDSVVVQKVVSLTFEDEDFEVVAVGNGEQAVRRLEDDFRPDIVLADIFMPAPNGYEVCERIKHDPRLQHIPVLLLVGTFEPYNETEARRVGADGVVTKPFQSIKDLVNKVGSLLGGGSGNREDEGDTRDLPEPRADERSAPRADAASAEADAGARTRQVNSHATSPLPWNEPRIMETGASEDADAARSAQDENPVAASAAEISFADLGMDDRMIEERPASQPDADVHSLFVLRPDTTTEEANANVRLDEEHRDEERRGETHDPPATADERHDWVLAPEHASPDIAESPVAASTADASTSWQERDEEVTLVNEPSPFYSQASRAEDSLLDLDDGEPPQALSEADDFILDLADDAPDTSSPAPSRWDASPAASATASAASTAAIGGTSPWAETSAQSSNATATAEQPSESVSAEAMRAVDAPGAFAEAAHGDVYADASNVAPNVVSNVAMDDEMPTMISSSALTGEESSGTTTEGDEGRDLFAARHVLEKSGTITSNRVPDLDSHGMSSFAEAAGLGGGARPRGQAYQEPETGMRRSRETASDEPAGGGQLTLEQLSPEVIDEIARRAVAHLSERVIREIAWEVVPDLAELLIKQRLDEDRKR